MTKATRRIVLTTRDEDLLRAIDRCPLTVRQLRTLSGMFQREFSSDRRLQDRLAQLTRAGMVRRFRYASLSGTGQFYYTLTPESFRVIHGDDMPMPGRGAFREIGIARHHHAFNLAEFLVHTLVAARSIDAELGDYVRENSLKLSADGDELFPDGAFTLTLPDRPSFQFYVELDNSTEPLNAPRTRDSWLRKLRVYDNLQNCTPTRFRVLGVVTRTKQRLQNLASLAASVALNPQRGLFLGVFLPDYIANECPLTSPIFTDHRGLKLSLLPSSWPEAPIRAANSHRTLTMIGARTEVPAVPALL
jgi:hypothetical protein